MYTMTVVNQKGGVGKTTTATQLFAGLSIRGYSVLGIDADPQGNLSTTLLSAYKSPHGDVLAEDVATIYDVFTQSRAIADALVEVKRGAVLSSRRNALEKDLRFANLDGVIGNQPKRDYLLRRALGPIAGDFDFCIIDAPPALGIYVNNALTASDAALVVTEPGEYAISGIVELADAIQQVKDYTNPDLTILGLLVTKYEGQTLLARGMVRGAREIAKKLGSNIFDTMIRKAVAIGEAQASAQDIFAYSPTSGVAKDYGKLIDEILEAIDNHGC